MEIINDEVGIHTHVYLFSLKATYEIILADVVEREALDRGWVKILALYPFALGIGVNNLKCPDL